MFRLAVDDMGRVKMQIVAGDSQANGYAIEDNGWYYSASKDDWVSSILDASWFKYRSNAELMIFFFKNSEIKVNKAKDPMEPVNFQIMKEEKMTIEQTLAERGNQYGKFSEHARITQNLKGAMQDSPNWANMRSDQKEALEMVQHKIGRILNGNPDFHDSWHDCVGYLKLVADTLVPVSTDTIKT